MVLASCVSRTPKRGNVLHRPYLGWASNDAALGRNQTAFYPLALLGLITRERVCHSPQRVPTQTAVLGFCTGKPVPPRVTRYSAKCASKWTNARKKTTICRVVERSVAESSLAHEKRRAAGATSRSAARRYAVGMFLCPAAVVKSSQKSRFTPEISNRPRHNASGLGSSLRDSLG